jgi:transposase
MARQHYDSDLPREQFEPVRALLESARKRTRPRQHDLYDVFCAVLYLLERGVSWRQLPPDLPPWRTVHEYFTQWSTARGTETSLLEQALQQIGNQKALDALHRMMARRR